MLAKEVNEIRCQSVVKKAIEDAYQQGRIEAINDVIDVLSRMNYLNPMIALELNKMKELKNGNMEDCTNTSVKPAVWYGNIGG